MTRTSSSTVIDETMDALEKALTNGVRTLMIDIDGGKTSLRAIGNKAASIAGSRPWLIALVGAGIAGLAYSLQKPRSKEIPVESLMSWENEGGTPLETGDVGPETETWMVQAIAARDAALKRLEDLFETGRATARTQADIAATLAEDIGKALRHDLSDLSDAAAERVVEARERAWLAYEEGRNRVQAGFEKAKENPAEVALAGIAVAALAAAFIPRTRQSLKPIVSRTATAAVAALAAKGVDRLVGENAKSAFPEDLAAYEKKLRARADKLVEDLMSSARTRRNETERGFSKAINRTRSSTSH